MPRFLFLFVSIGWCWLNFTWFASAFAETHRPTPFHRHHIIERCGLLMLISLGEIMLSIRRGFGALFGDHPVIAAAAGSVSGLVIVFSVWWVCFCEEEHLTTSKLPQPVIWRTWSPRTVAA